ncbi:MAG TPA: YkgJ family cysteine cluster protein [Blastocatellia bacterium]|nr:YkgJ family cysteine cluster protein [Blastocatellia bacterium]
MLRHRKDRIYGTACKFLDEATRRCTIYDARPDVCREFPYNNGCHYYDYLIAERAHQDDPEAVPFGAIS